MTFSNQIQLSDLQGGEYLIKLVDQRNPSENYHSRWETVEFFKTHTVSEFGCTTLSELIDWAKDSDLYGLLATKSEFFSKEREEERTVSWVGFTPDPILFAEDFYAVEIEDDCGLLSWELRYPAPAGWTTHGLFGSKKAAAEYSFNTNH